MLLTCIILGSCNNTGNIPMQRKVYTPDITIREVDGMRYAYYNGNLYTGEVYSSDEKNMMEIRNGIAIVAYGNYGSTSNEFGKAQVEIHEDYYTTSESLDRGTDLSQEHSLGELFASAMVDGGNKKILETLPRCSFSR